MLWGRADLAFQIFFPKFENDFEAGFSDRVLPGGCKSETQCPALVILMALGSPRERVP
jgi:hypothetical protein